ncbi:MAG: hypothetical protein QNJ04_16170 [Desulfobacterales bacterium]|nr:hypothetical protein [Desulfobacterales bacterium]
MKAGKHDEILDRIDSMPNWQVFLCCRALVILLDRELGCSHTSLRPRDLVVADFNHFPRHGSIAIQRWCRSLAPVRRPVLARLGRFLMSMCLNRGYLRAVVSACATAQAPVANLGDLQPAQIMAALGVVMSWMSNGQEIPLPQAELFDRRPDACDWPSRRSAADPADPMSIDELVAADKSFRY